jgi:AraC-like DNA-binding protein
VGGDPRGSLIAPLAGALVQAACERGVAADALLRALEIEPAHLADPERRVPFSCMVAAWELAMRSARDEGLPVAVGCLASIERYGVLGYALYTRPTAGEALRALGRYHDLINDSGRWAIGEDGAGTTVITWQRSGDGGLGERAANEQVLSAFAAFGGAIAEGGLNLRWVRFRHPAPRRTSAHEQHFAVPIHWGAGCDAIGVPTSELARTPRGADPILAGYFVTAADEALRRVASDTSWSGQVARVISDALASGIPSLAEVARALGVSERTARRRLSSEHEKFEVLIARVQQERATELLRGTAPLRDVAFALGFSDATAFSRAYRRWTGRAPSDDRRAAASPPR